MLTFYFGIYFGVTGSKSCDGGGGAALWMHCLNPLFPFKKFLFKEVDESMSISSKLNVVLIVTILWLCFVG